MLDRSRVLIAVACLALMGQAFIAVSPVQAERDPTEPIAIGSRLELFVDRHLIHEMTGVELKLHSLQPAEPSAEPWELAGHYGTVLRDGDRFRMYSRDYLIPGAYWKNVGIEAGTLNEVTVYAESPDGIRWSRPNLGLYQAASIDPRLMAFAEENKVRPRTEQGNIVLAGYFGPSHNFTPFIDSRPGVPAGERYKAVGGKKYAPQFRKEWEEKYGPDGLSGFVSPDGQRWEKLQDGPIIPGDWGAFDSQNPAFWSEVEEQYLIYFRYFKDGKRGILRSTSPDFRNWTDPVEVNANLPGEELYTNNVQPYFRAPHISIAPATRYVDGQRPNTFVIFMTSRDGINFDREFQQQTFKPTDPGDRTNYIAWSNGGTQTGPRELSFYGPRERYTLRLDGFASLHAGETVGTMTTNTLTFLGDHLLLNFATRDGGFVELELLDAAGKPIEGYSAEDSVMLRGDEIEKAASWKGGREVGSLAGRPVRLRLILKNADVYSLRFAGDRK